VAVGVLAATKHHAEQEKPLASSQLSMELGR
jgi:hypothetical protein